MTFQAVAQDSKLPQSITFPPLPSELYFMGPGLHLRAMASSGLPVSYTIASGPGWMVLANGEPGVVAIGPGTVVVRASQQGDDVYAPAPDVDYSFVVLGVPSVMGQSIYFETISDRFYRDPPFQLVATSSSGLPVKFTLVSGPATLSDDILTVTGVGIVIVRASQAGNESFAEANDVYQSFAAVKKTQTLTFPVESLRMPGDSSFPLNATASSGLPVSVAVVSGAATITDGRVNVSAPGVVVLRASQPGDLDYEPVSEEQSFLMVSERQTPGVTPLGPLADRQAASFDVGQDRFFTHGNARLTRSGWFRDISSDGWGVELFADENAGSVTFIFSASFSDGPGPDLVLATGATSGGEGNLVLIEFLAGDTVASLVTQLQPQALHVFEIPGEGIRANAFRITNITPPLSPGTEPGMVSLLGLGIANAFRFYPVEEHTFGDPPFSLAPYVRSDLPVIFHVLSGPGVIVGDQISLLGAGEIIIQAERPLDPFFWPARAQQTLNVRRTPQQIRASPPAEVFMSDGPFEFVASTSAGLPVTYALLGGPATLSGNVISPTGPGLVAIRVWGEGNDNYAPVSADYTLTIVGTSNTIQFDPIPTQSFANRGITLTATASSGLPVEFELISGPGLLTGGDVSFTGVGQIVVRAMQRGDEVYQPAAGVEQSFLVEKAGQTIVFDPIADRAYGPALFSPVASASSGLPIFYSVVSGPAAMVANRVEVTGIGRVVLRASQEGDNWFNRAPDVEQSFTVHKAEQTLSLEAIGRKVLGEPPVLLRGSASSGLPVIYSLVSGPASIAGDRVTFTGVGTVIVRASQPGDGNYNPAADVDQSFTVERSGQALSFEPISPKVFGAAPFAIRANSSTGLPVTYSVVSGPATIVGDQVTLTGGGSVTIRASQPGDGNYQAAADLDQTFSVERAGQTLSFEPISPKVFGAAPFAISANSSAGLPVTYSVVSGPATIVGDQVTLIGTGTVTLRASQPGDGNYQGAADLDQSFSVERIGQTLSFDLISPKVFGAASFAIRANSSAGLPVTYSVVSGPATIVGDQITLTGTGIVTLRASQPGDGNYQAAADLDQTFTVERAGQTLAFEPISPKVFGAAPFAIRANSSAGLPVTYSVVSGPATIVGDQVTLTGAGTVMLRASQPGDGNYQAAADLDQSFTVERVGQTLSFELISPKVFGAAPFAIRANSTIGLPVTYSVVSGPATIVGDQVTLTGAGTVTLRASQPGDGNYQAAADLDQSFTVERAGQILSFDPVTLKMFGAAPFAIRANSSAGLPVSYSVVSGPATIVGDQVTLTGAGTVTLRASQPGDGNYQAAADLDQSFTVERVGQALSFEPISPKVFGAAPFAIRANSTIGLPVTYSVVSGPATIVGDQVTLTGAGTVTLRASQPGDGNYQAAADLDQSFTVERGGQILSFDPVTLKMFGAAPFAISANSSAGLPVSYSVVSGPATIVGDQVTLTGAGTVTLRASQPGDGNYQAAADLDQSFTVERAEQAVSFKPIGTRAFDERPFRIEAVASSGLKVTFTVLSGPAMVVDDQIILKGAGSIVLRATQDGDENFNPAPPVEQTVIIDKAEQTIAFEASPDHSFGEAPIALLANASSGLPVSFKVISGPGEFRDERLVLLGAGSILIRAQQAGDDNFAAAPVVEQTLTVAKASQTIHLPPIPNQIFGAGPTLLIGTASSGLPVQFEIVSGPAAIQGQELTVQGGGPVIVRAGQSGDDNYAPAPEVEAKFEVEFALSVSVTGHGRVVVEPQSVSYTNGSVVKLQAIPDATYTFSGWSGAIDGPDARTTLIISTNHQITARFIQALLPPPVLDVPPGVVLDNDGFHFVIHGTASAKYLVEASNDLTNWRPVATITGDAVPVRIADSKALQSMCQFYRVQIVH